MTVAPLAGSPHQQKSPAQAGLKHAESVKHERRPQPPKVHAREHALISPALASAVAGLRL